MYSVKNKNNYSNLPASHAPVGWLFIRYTNLEHVFYITIGFLYAVLRFGMAKSTMENFTLPPYSQTFFVPQTPSRYRSAEFEAHHKCRTFSSLLRWLLWLALTSKTSNITILFHGPGNAWGTWAWGWNFPVFIQPHLGVPILQKGMQKSS